MRTRLRSKVTLLFMSLGLLLAIPAVAFAADNIITDGDLVTTGDQLSRNLGTLAPGATFTADPTATPPVPASDVKFYLDCNGTNHFNSGETADLNVTATSKKDSDGNTITGGTLSATSLSNFSGPSSWPSDGGTGAACNSFANAEIGTSNVTIVAPKKAGSYTYTVTYTLNRDTGTASNELDIASAQDPNDTGSVTVTFTFSVPNVAPTIDSFQVSNTDDGTSAIEGDTKTYTITASDANEDTLSYSLTALPGGASTTITGANTASPQVKFNAPGTVTLQASVSDGVNTAVTQNKIVTVAAANTAPTVPGAPTTTSNPNQGEFTLTWDESTDAQNNPITYTLQHKDADDADFSEVAPSISGNSYSFTAASPEDEGTWTYRVQASDGSLSSNFSADSSAIKVDQSRPNAPLANEGTPDYTATNGDKWFKTSATVSFTETGDPTLADGSDGSGVVSVSDPQSRSATGALNYSGTATDDVGLVSLPTTGTVHVDATNPAVNITCPSSSAILASTASANWSASDVGSGLASAASGSVALNTSAIAASLTATAPTATDNVGLQSAAATCNYSVAAAFDKFLQPIDGDMVNAGKTGRVYPIKWQLRSQGANGPLISDAQGLALAQQMSVEQKGVPCTPDQVDSLETDVAAGSTTIRYDEASDQFIFNYKAPATKGCYDLNLKKADGVNTKTVKFTFTK